MRALVTTTTWNCIDLIHTFLTHYQRLGFRHVLVMDFDSTDGTRDILESSRWRSFVTVVPFPGIAGLDSSNLLQTIARDTFERDSWCLFCDPDEFLVTPTMSITGSDLAEATARPAALTIARFNVTAESSIARLHQDRLSPLDALTLRIDLRHDRTIESDALRDQLTPPWIFTSIPGKVLVATAATSRIGEGDHSADTGSPKARAPDGVYLLHYPFRSFQCFADKIALAESDFDANPGLPPSYGWQLRRWIRLARRGLLHDEYLSQFVRDEEVDRLIECGTLTRDLSVLDLHLR